MSNLIRFICNVQKKAVQLCVVQNCQALKFINITCEADRSKEYCNYLYNSQTFKSIIQFAKIFEIRTCNSNLFSVPPCSLFVAIAIEAFNKLGKEKELETGNTETENQEQPEEVY